MKISERVNVYVQRKKSPRWPRIYNYEGGVCMIAQNKSFLWPIAGVLYGIVKRLKNSHT